MKNYCLDALAPLVFRGGKPFGAQSDTEDILFPFPSSVAGLIRSQVMWQKQWGFEQEHEGRGQLTHQQVQELQQIATQGPFLVRYEANNQITVLVPKPADALYFKDPKHSEKIKLMRLAPQGIANKEECGCDLPRDLLPVKMVTDVKGKPQGGAAYWCLNDSLRWQAGEELSFDEVQQHGAQTLSIETRTHVALDDVSFAASEGKLFQTAAYDLGHQAKAKHGGWQEQHYGFLIRTTQELPDSLVRFGGEGRLSRLTTAQLKGDEFKVSNQLVEDIKQQGGLRLTLLTPAIFANGWLPSWLDQTTLEGVLPHTNIKVKLRAVAADRWLPVSGWDLNQHKPKAMRKAVAAGAVYWFECCSDDLDNIHQIAFQSISDQEQDKLDGFGIVSVAAWQKK